MYRLRFSLLERFIVAGCGTDIYGLLIDSRVYLFPNFKHRLHQQQPGYARLDYEYM